MYARIKRVCSCKHCTSIAHPVRAARVTNITFRIATNENRLSAETVLAVAAAAATTLTAAATTATVAALYEWIKHQSQWMLCASYRESIKFCQYSHENTHTTYVCKSNAHKILAYIRLICLLEISRKCVLFSLHIPCIPCIQCIPIAIVDSMAGGLVFVCLFLSLSYIVLSATAAPHENINFRTRFITPNAALFSSNAHDHLRIGFWCIAL